MLGRPSDFVHITGTSSSAGVDVRRLTRRDCVSRELVFKLDRHLEDGFLSTKLFKNPPECSQSNIASP